MNNRLKILVITNYTKGDSCICISGVSHPPAAGKKVDDTKDTCWFY